MKYSGHLETSCTGVKAPSQAVKPDLCHRNNCLRFKVFALNRLSNSTSADGPSRPASWTPAVAIRVRVFTSGVIKCSQCFTTGTMPKERVPFPTEDAPGYDPANPYADKVALKDHRNYMLGRHFVGEAKVRVRHCTSKMFKPGRMPLYWLVPPLCSCYWHCQWQYSCTAMQDLCDSSVYVADFEGPDEGVLRKRRRQPRNRVQRHC